MKDYDWYGMIVEFSYMWLLGVLILLAVALAVGALYMIVTKSIVVSAAVIITVITLFCFLVWFIEES